MTDLRDRIAEALTREHHRRAADRIEASPEEHQADFADVVMGVVQPELDRLRARLDYWQGRALVHARAAETAEERAEQAEELLRIAHDTSNRSEAERARAVQRAETAEAENARLRAYHQQIGDL